MNLNNKRKHYLKIEIRTEDKDENNEEDGVDLMSNFDIEFLLIKNLENYMILDKQVDKVLIPISIIHLVECTELEVKDEINGAEWEEEKPRKKKVK